MGLKDYSVKVGIKLDENSVSNIRKDLNEVLKNENFEISFNSKGLDSVSKKLDEISTKLERISGGNNFKKTSSGAKDASKNVDNLNKNLEKTTKHIKNQTFATDNWAYNWTKAMQSFLTYNTVTQFFNNAVNGIKDMIQQVADLDSSLTELKKVTDLEGDSLEKFIDKAYSAGKEVAKTGTEMVDAATSFAKAGYDDSIALDLGKVAAMYTNIADEEISTADAADFVIAQLKAFNLEADDANKTLENSYHIIDAVNEVSNNFAVSSSDIATNLGKASAVMSGAGNSLEQMIGLMTAGTEVTRNASKVANGLKTITLRLQGMNDEGEKDLKLQAQMEGLFQKLGISVYDANGELKNTYDILATLAPVYNELTNAEKAYVTETIAGKYQAQNAAAILQNWGTAVDATTTALNSNGSAARENEKVLDSVQGHLQRLNSAWEELSKNLINNSLMKFFIDLGTIILNVANSGIGQWVIKFAILKGLLTAGTAVFSRLTKSIKGTNVALTEYVVKSNQVSAANVKMNASLMASGKNFKLQTVGLEGLSMTTTKAAGSFGILSKAMNVFGKSNIILLIISLIPTAIDFITKLQNKVKDAAKEAAEKLQETESKLEGLKEELNGNKEKIDELKSKKGLTFLEKDELQKLKDSNKLLEEQIKLLEKREKSERKDAQKKADKAAEQDYNKLTGYDKKVRVVKDTSVLDRLSMGHTDVSGSNQFADQKRDADSYIESLENLRNVYKNNKDILGEIDDEINRVKTDSSATTLTQQKEYATLNNAIKNNIQSFKEKDAEIKSNNDKIKEYQKQIEEYESKNPWANNDKLKNMKPNFEFGSDAEKEYLEYEKAKKELENIKQLNEENEEIKKASKKSLEEEAEALEKILTNEDYRDNLSKETLSKYEKRLKEIEKLTHPNKYKDDAFKDFFNSGDNKEAVASLLNMKNASEVSAEGVQELAEKFPELKDMMDDSDMSAEEFANELNNMGEKSVEAAEKVNELGLEGFASKMETLANSYGILTSAAEEFNENGYITVDTFKSLMENDLWQYLNWTAEGLDANTGALINEADALKYNELASLQAAFAKDALAIATGNVKDISPLAQSALSGLEGGISSAGDMASAKAGNFFQLSAAITSVQKAAENKGLGKIDVESKKAELQKLVDVYNSAAAGVANINLKSSGGSGGGSRKSGSGGGGKKSGSGSGSGSSSSKSEKEWWEKELEKLKDQFDYSDITIEQYISGLENLLGKVGQGTDAWKKINKELQKQKLDKVKADYDAGRISLDQYIISLQNLQKAYKAGTDAWNDLATAIKKAKLDKLKKQQDDLKSALSAVNDVLEKQIDKYEEAKDAADKKYDDEIEKLEELQDKLDDQNDDYERAQQAVVDYLDEQMSAIEKQRDTVESYYDNVLDAIEKMNEKQQESLELAEAYEALMNAMTQKTKKVYKEGLGWIWTTDAEAIRDAKQTYEDLLKNATTKEIEDQKNATINSLEEQITALQDYIDSWDKVLDKFDNDKNRNLADLLLGENWTEMVSQLDPQVVDDFSDAYYELQKNLEETEKQIEELNKQKEEEDKYWEQLIEDLEQYKDKWDDVADIYEQAQDALKARQIMGANWEKEILDRRLDVLENFKNKYNAILAEIDKVDNMSTNQASGYTALRLPGYANGGEVDYTGLAVLHGTPNKPEYVLNNTQMRNLLGNLTRPQTTSAFDAGKGSVVNNYSFGDISLPNVTNARQFANELKSLLNITKNQ